ncbi:hypothetical protein Celaphus_00016455, partial [Cervus elaphus hippelaphus]
MGAGVGTLRRSDATRLFVHAGRQPLPSQRNSSAVPPSRAATSPSKALAPQQGDPTRGPSGPLPHRLQTQRHAPGVSLGPLFTEVLTPVLASSTSPGIQGEEGNAGRRRRADTDAPSYRVQVALVELLHGALQLAPLRLPLLEVPHRLHGGPLPAGPQGGNLLNCHSQSESLPPGAGPLPRTSPSACGVTRANVGQQRGGKVLAGETAGQGRSVFLELEGLRQEHWCDLKAGQALQTLLQCPCWKRCPPVQARKGLANHPCLFAKLIKATESHPIQDLIVLQWEPNKVISAKKNGKSLTDFRVEKWYSMVEGASMTLTQMIWRLFQPLGTVMTTAHHSSCCWEQGHFPSATLHCLSREPNLNAGRLKGFDYAQFENLESPFSVQSLSKESLDNRMPGNTANQGQDRNKDEFSQNRYGPEELSCTDSLDLPIHLEEVKRALKANIVITMEATTAIMTTAAEAVTEAVTSGQTVAKRQPVAGTRGTMTVKLHRQDVQSWSPKDNCSPDIIGVTTEDPFRGPNCISGLRVFLAKMSPSEDGTSLRSESSRTGTLPSAPEVKRGWMKETVRPLWKVKYSVKAKDCHSPTSKPPRPDELPEEMLAPPSRECLGDGKAAVPYKGWGEVTPVQPSQQGSTWKEENKADVVSAPKGESGDTSMDQEMKIVPFYQTLRMITTAVSYDSEITSAFPGGLLPLEAATLLQPHHLHQAWVSPPSISPTAGVTPCLAPGSCVQHCTASSAPVRRTRAPRTPSSPLAESTPTCLFSAYQLHIHIPISRKQA